MKQRLSHPVMRILLIGGLLVIVSSTAAVLLADDADNSNWAAPARARREKNPTPADTRSIDSGKNLYMAQCADCHGDAGKGNGPSGRELNPKPANLTDPSVTRQTDGALFWKITNGRKTMPGFESLTSENERWDIINYLRATTRPASTQPAKDK